MIGFFVETLFHIECYQNIIDACQRKGISCCYVLNDQRKGELEWEMMIDSLKKIVESGVLKNCDYEWASVLKEKGKVFEVLLSPYYLVQNQELARKHARLIYGLAKDRWNYAWWNSQYDAILTYGTEDTSRFECYQTAYPVGNCRWDTFLRNFASVEDTHSHQERKKGILYAPTYGELSSIDGWFSDIADLSNEFEVYVKPHHGTLFKKSEEERLRRIQESGLNMISSLQELVDILPAIDVIISDGSGMVFDALLLKKPLIQCRIDFNPNLLSTASSSEYHLEGYAHQIQDTSQLRDSLSEVLNEEFNSTHEKLRNYFFMYTDGFSGERAAKVLEGLINWDISDVDLKTERTKRQRQAFRQLYGSK